jgi:hypothetical protein
MSSFSSDKPAVEELDLRQAPRDYSVEKNLDISNRIQKYETVNSFLESIDKPLNFCDCHNSEIEQLNSESTTSVCPNIRIVSQIGSNSVAGVVYKIIIDRNEAAMKVMPVTNDELLIQNKKEIQIANICSKLVISGQSIFFPIVYGSYVCNNIKYKKGTKFLVDSLKYSVSKNLYNWLVVILTEKGIITQPKVKVALRKFKTSSSIRNVQFDRSEPPEVFLDKMIKEVNIFFEDNKLDMPEIDRTKFLSSEAYQNLIPKLEGNILISEIANADIVNYSKEIIIKGQILPNEKWISIIEGVLFGIRDMQKENIIHKDLHPGNVLVLIKNEGEVIIPLIHDFGSSEIIESWSGEDTRSFDIFTFLSKLINYQLDIEKPGTSEPAKITDSMSPEFLDFIKRFLSIIEEQSKDPSHETPEFMDHIIAIFNSEKTQLIRGGFNKNSYLKNKKKTKKIRKKYKKKLTKKRMINSKKKHISRRIIGSKY